MTGSVRGDKDTPAPGGVRLLGAYQAVLPEELPDLFPVCGRDTGAQLPEGHAEVSAAGHGGCTAFGFPAEG